MVSNTDAKTPTLAAENEAGHRDESILAPLKVNGRRE